MRYYFLGIGGTAMASLAGLLKMKGHKVWGTDKGIYPPMSDFLKSHQIRVNEGYSKDNLKESFDLVVIGNSLSRGNEEVEEILDKKLPFTSLPKLLHDEFVIKHHTIVITGTHGKTSTTAILSWIFEVAGLSPTFLIGGIAKNFSSSIKLGNGKHFIIEGDEYDSAFFDKRPKFLHYFPQHLIINNIEFDHADIYHNLAEIKNEFKKLLRLIPSNGLIVANGDDPNVRNITQNKYSRLQLTGHNDNADWSYANLKIRGIETKFDLLYKGKVIDHFVLSQPGEHQVQNSLSAIAVSHDLGIDLKIIKKALESYQGVKRRLEYWGKLNGAIVFDDFAHHPTAVKNTLDTIKKVYPQKRIIALFEPRTNTTVQNIFQEELFQALSIADMVLITPIHRPERIPSPQRLSVSKLVQNIKEIDKIAIYIDSHSEIKEILLKTLCQDDVLVILTNGNLGGQYEEIKKIIQLDNVLG